MGSVHLELHLAFPIDQRFPHPPLLLVAFKFPLDKSN